MKCYLRIGNDYLEDAIPCATIKDAVLVYQDTAQELARYDQRIEASIHIAPTLEEVGEYPDYVLSLGPRGGVAKERTS